MTGRGHIEALVEHMREADRREAQSRISEHPVGHPGARRFAVERIRVEHERADPQTLAEVVGQVLAALDIVEGRAS